MNQFLLNFSGGFFYIPKDKSSYIPAAIEMALLIIFVFVMYRWIRRIAARQAEKAQHLEKRALQERDERIAREKTVSEIQK